MDRLFSVNRPWFDDRYNLNAGIVGKVFDRWLPHYIDRWELIDAGAAPVSERDGMRIVPIGDIPFSRKWLNALSAVDPEMTPLEVPSVLMPFAGREIHRMHGRDIPSEMLDGSKWFVKDASHLKTWTSLLYEDADLSYYIEPDTEYAVSEKLELAAEYRTFVLEDEIVGCELYSGSPTVFPDGGRLEAMVSAYSRTSRPRSYTLDVGVAVGRCGVPFDVPATVPIEVHPFVACGLYGFCGRELPDMFDAGWQWYLSEYGE